MSEEKAAAGDPPQTLEQTVTRAFYLLENGSLAAAEELFKKLLAQSPDQPAIVSQLGLIAHRSGRTQEAFQWFRRVVALTPDDAQAHNHLGVVLRKLGKLDEAADSYARAIAIAPDRAENHFNLAATRQAQDRHNEALAGFQRAVELKPDYAQALNNLGNLLAKSGRTDEALARYRAAIAARADYAAAHNNLGSLLDSLGDRGQAIASFRRAITLKPTDAEFHNNLGLALKKNQEPDQAIACYEQALILNPGFVEAHYNLAVVLHEQTRLDDAAHHYRRALRLKPDYLDAHGNLVFLMAYGLESSGEDILSESQKLAALHRYRGPRPVHANTLEPERRLRVGLVSGDLRHHSVSYFLTSILAELDPAEIEVFAYATSAHEDDLTARLKSMVPMWRNVTRASDEELARIIGEDRIDILVDLSGHTQHSRLLVFSRKPAPVQVTWLGYNATTGLSDIDYFLGDPYTLPASEAHHFSETPWPLPDIWLCFAPPDEAIEVAPLPSGVAGPITFGSFNSLTKISEPTVACWAAVLAALPDSRLYLKARQLQTEPIRQTTRARFAAHGLDPDRLILEGFSPDRSSHLQRYHRIDMALDPFPYVGVTTSVEALWMGRPVLTLNGDRFAAHLGGSINHNLGLDDWIAASADEFVAKAVRLASDRAALATLSQGLRGRLLASPVCDAERFARNLEQAFRAMWRKWCADAATGQR